MQLLIEEVKSLVGISLSDEHISAFEIYAEQMADWNTRVNLTGIKEPVQVRQKHFLDSLSCLLVMKELNKQAIIDVGAGAGFPGIVLKIVNPDMKLALIESSTKKCMFLEHIVNRLDLKQVEIINGRAEVIGQDANHREKYDWAVARAVARLPVLVEYLLPLVKIGGQVLAQKGDNISEEVSQAKNAINTLGGNRLAEVSVELKDKLSKRNLVVIQKISATPAKYPRHDGAPAKNPL